MCARCKPFTTVPVYAIKHVPLDLNAHLTLLNKHFRIPVDAQETILCTAVATASTANDQNERVWEIMLMAYKLESNPIFKKRYIKALSCTKEKEKLTR